MKRFALAAAAAFALATPALASDLPAQGLHYYAPVPAAYDWTGFYLGGNAGWGWGRGRSSYTDPYFGTLAGSDAMSGFVGGVQAGYNYQFGNRLVAGLEADLDYAGLRGSGTDRFSLWGVPLDVAHSSRLDWFGTVRGRLGYALGGGWLPYVTGGFAYGRGSVSGQGTLYGYDVADFSGSHFLSGWALGGGIEKKISAQWSAKAEYLHLDFGSVNTTARLLGGGLVPIRTKFTDDVFRLGLNYHF